MSKIKKFINNQPVAVIIGPETKLFFKRFSALEQQGIFADGKPVEKLPTYAGDEDAFFSQVFIIKEQTGVSLETAIAGTLFIKGNERTPWFDPLTLPSLN